MPPNDISQESKPTQCPNATPPLEILVRDNCGKNGGESSLQNPEKKRRNSRIFCDCSRVQKQTPAYFATWIHKIKWVLRRFPHIFGHLSEASPTTAPSGVRSWDVAVISEGIIFMPIGVDKHLKPDGQPSI